MELSVFTSLIFSENYTFLYSPVIVVIVYVFYRYETRNFNFWKKRNVKGPKPLFLFGDILNNILSPQIHKNYQKNAVLYGKIHGLFAFQNPILNVAEPELVKRILVKDFSKFVNRLGFSFEHELIDAMLNFSSNETWKKLRTKISPVFSTAKIKRMFPLIEDCIIDVINNFDRFCSSDEDVDVNDVYGKFILDVIARVAFATNVNVDKKLKETFVRNAEHVFNPSLYNVIMFIISRKLRLQKYFLPQLDFFVNFIESTINQRNRENTSDTSKRVDFLQLLLDVEELEKSENTGRTSDDHENESQCFEKKSFKDQKLTKTEIMSQCVMFFVVGYHTTTRFLVFASYLLALNPDKQEKLFQEIKNQLDLNNRKLDYDALMTMHYLNSVVCETLRIYPPASHLSRVSNEEYTVDVNLKFTLPKNTNVYINVYTLHHDEEYFPNPEQFIPERFLPENRDKIVPFSYLPFGEGQRNCVAMRFALLEVKMALFHTIYSFKIAKSSKTPLNLKIRNVDGLLRPEKFCLKFSRRHR